MVVLTSSKSISKRRKSHCKLESIPRELLTEILARVSQNSITDLFNAKAACKTLNLAASEDYVYKHVVLDTIGVDPWQQDEVHMKAFLDRCLKCGNPEALFRKGLAEFFSKEVVNLVNLSFNYLLRAACMGHRGATYVCGIVLICFGGERRQAGLELLSHLRSSELPSNLVIKQCREAVTLVLSRRWILNHRIGYESNNLLEHDCKVKSRDRLWDDGEFDVLEDYDNCCPSCQWNHETKLFFRMLRRGGFNC